MLYRDIHTYLLRDTSSKGIDIVLELVKYMDWGSEVRVDEKEIAKNAGTTKRYVKEVINKISKDNLGLLKNTRGKTYRFLKGKSTVLHSKSDEYCKKFEFLYSKEFKDLGLYAKRILLTAAMGFSLTGQGKAYLSMDTFIYRTELSSGLIPSKSELYSVIGEINDTFNSKFKVGYVSSVVDKKEYVYVEVLEGELDKVIHNYTERKYVREELFKEGYVGYLEDEYSIEIEKVGKSIFNYLYKAEGLKNYNGDYIVDITEVAREIYNKSISRLAKKLHSLVTKGEDISAISAYFSSVVISVVMEILAGYKHRKGIIAKVIGSIAGKYREEEYLGRIHNLDVLIKVLEDWSHSWINVRVRGNEENWERNINNIKKNGEVKNSLIEMLFEVESRLEQQVGKSISEGLEWLKYFKESIENYIDVKTESIGLKPN